VTVSSSSAPQKHVLCTGIAVLDMLFRVERFPKPEVKTQASDFRTVAGGNAANAAVAIAHLGARASFTGPLGGPAGTDTVGDTLLKLIAEEGIDVTNCPRVDGVPSPISAISIDGRGERAIANFRDERLAQTRPADPDALVANADAVIADNRFPAYVRDVCVAARKRGIPVVLDADEPRPDSIELLSIVSHVVFSAEGLRATAGTDHLGRALVDISKQTRSFVAVTDGANGQCRRYTRRRRHIPRRVHVDAGRAGERAPRDALCGRNRGTQMHALWRHSGRTGACRSGSVSREAEIATVTRIPHAPGILLMRP
jgi:sulfofructose kinase